MKSNWKQYYKVAKVLQSFQFNTIYRFLDGNVSVVKIGVTENDIRTFSNDVSETAYSQGLVVGSM